jgi:hypothetical protein
MFAGAWAFLLVSLCLVLQLTAAAAQAAFLQDQLPLRVLVTTPTALSTYSNSTAAVTLTGRQALTVSLMLCTCLSCWQQLQQLHLSGRERLDASHSLRIMPVQPVSSSCVSTCL